MIEFSIRTEGNGSRTFTERIRALLQKRKTAAVQAVAVQVMKDTDPYVPFLTGSLVQRTHLDGDTIVYPGPYARYLYYGKRMVDSQTGRGPYYIPGVGYRFRKGATLVATNDDLHFNKAGHPQATSHWFEVSKAANMERWERVAERAMNGR